MVLVVLEPFAGPDLLPALFQLVLQRRLVDDLEHAGAQLGIVDPRLAVASGGDLVRLAVDGEPQLHAVEGLADLVDELRLEPCRARLGRARRQLHRRAGVQGRLHPKVVIGLPSSRTWTR